MIDGYRNILNADPGLQGIIRNVYKDALGVIDRVATSRPTADSLPHGYVQFANIDSTRRLYINIEDTIYEIGNVTPNNLSITSQAQGSLLYYNSTSSWTAFPSGASTQFLKGGSTPSWSTVSLSNIDNVAPGLVTPGGVAYYSTSSLTATASGSSTQYLKGGAVPTWDTVSTTSDIEWISTTSVSGVQNTGDITISQGVSYLVKFYLKGNSSAFVMRFNSDSGSNYANLGSAFATTPDVSITMFTLDNTDTAVGIGHFILSTVNTDQMMVQGAATYVASDGNLTTATLGGYWDASTTVTDFEFVISSGSFEGEIILYKLNTS